MFRIELLEAGHGDCLWIEYGDPTAPHRILIDAGPTGTYKRALRPKLRALPEAERRFELLVITHVDADHIADVLELLADQETGFAAKDVWFNGYRHLPDERPEVLGPVQGEKLTDLLVRPGTTWNGAFRKGAVVVPPTGALPRIELDGGFALTLLSPTPEKLAQLKPEWIKETRKAGLDPTAPRPAEIEVLGAEPAGGAVDVDVLAGEPFSEDTAVANGSSIAVLAEYDGRRVLFGADAHPGVLRSSIQRLGSADKLALDACKLPHHGSKANVSRPLLDLLQCQRYLFSTNGAHFKHPDRQAVARVIKFGGPTPELTFNYHSRYNEVWDSTPLRERYGYSTVFPDAGAQSVALEWR